MDNLQALTAEEQDDQAYLPLHLIIQAVRESGLSDIHVLPADRSTSNANRDVVAVMAALKTVEAPSDGRDCPICLGEVETAAVWKETACGHTFHGRCLEKWLARDVQKRSCPMCRRRLHALSAASSSPGGLAAGHGTNSC